jgi:hypothetical protein
METCQILSYIMVALIVALSIHLLSKIIRGRSQENFGSVEPYYDVNTLETCALKNKDKLESFADNNNSEPSGQEVGHTNMSVPASVIRGEAGNAGGAGCTVCDTSEQVDDYIRESLLHKAQMCKEKDVFSPEQVDNYRDKFLAFRNGVWQPSQREDAVDRINDMYLSGNTDLSRNHKDMKIRDVYDDISKGTNLYSQNCVRMPTVDNTMRDGNYTVDGARGDYFARDNWVYNNEKVMNGGEFMSGIMPSDSMANTQMAV